MIYVHIILIIFINQLKNYKFGNVKNLLTIHINNNNPKTLIKQIKSVILSEKVKLNVKHTSCNDISNSKQEILSSTEFQSEDLTVEL